MIINIRYVLYISIQNNISVEFSKLRQKEDKHVIFSFYNILRMQYKSNQITGSSYQALKQSVDFQKFQRIDIPWENFPAFKLYHINLCL